MDNHDARPAESAVLDDLMSLRASGATTDALARCQALANMIFGSGAPVLDSTSPDRRNVLGRQMANILSYVATAAQEQAHKERGKELQPQENRIFQAAAAAELMMFTDPVLFEEMRKSGRRRDDDGWNEISQRKGYREPNSAWMRQLRAGIWIGGQTDRSVREKVRILLAAFESVIHDYLDVEDHRAELRAFAVRHLESLTPFPTTPIPSAPIEQEQRHVATGVKTWRFARRFSKTTLVVSVTVVLMLITSGIAWWRVANSSASHAVNSPTSPPQTWSASRNGPVADPSIDPSTYQGGWGLIDRLTQKARSTPTQFLIVPSTIQILETNAISLVLEPSTLITFGMTDCASNLVKSTGCVST